MHRRIITFILLVLGLAANAFSQLPARGKSAPPLRLTELLQAHPGTHVDWSSLRGKVVVLEFWATWCAPCIASIPHLNQLAASVDSEKVKFISVDDENRKTVLSFLAKKPISGWIGLDATSAVFGRYGVVQRPRTIIVDTDGKIAAVRSLEDIKAADLLALADRKDAKFQPVTRATQQLRLPPPSASDTVFEVSLSKAPADTRFQMGHTGNGDMFITGAKPAFLLSMAYGVAEDRFLLKGVLPEGLYNLRAVLAGGDESLTKSVLQGSVAAGLHLHIQSKSATKEALVLTSTAKTETRLTRSPLNVTGMVGYWKGKIHLVHASMDDLALQLETVLQTPVVNETKLEGYFHAEIQISKTDETGARDAVADALGLSLTRAPRPLSMIEVRVAPTVVPGESVQPE